MAHSDSLLGSGMEKVPFAATPYKRQYQMPGCLFSRLADLEFFPITLVQIATIKHPGSHTIIIDLLGSIKQ